MTTGFGLDNLDNPTTALNLFTFLEAAAHAGYPRTNFKQTPVGWHCELFSRAGTPHPHGIGEGKTRLDAAATALENLLAAGR